jgi:hypothetical protein
MTNTPFRASQFKWRGFEVDIKWEKGELVSACIYSGKANNTKVKYGNIVKEIALSPNEKYEFQIN